MGPLAPNRTVVIAECEIRLTDGQGVFRSKKGRGKRGQVGWIKGGGSTDATYVDMKSCICFQYVFMKSLEEKIVKKAMLLKKYIFFYVRIFVKKMLVLKDEK